MHSTLSDVLFLMKSFRDEFLGSKPRRLPGSTECASMHVEAFIFHEVCGGWWGSSGRLNQPSQ